MGRGLGGQRGDGKGTEGCFAWGDEQTMQCAGDVLLSCTLKTCMVLQTDVTPINLI